MNLFSKVATKMEIVKDLVRFLWTRKMWWMIPLVILLVLLIAVLAVESTAGLAPFLYTFI